MNEKVVANVSNVLLTLYLLGSTVILLNLLIARMANTHNRIDSRSLQEWSYFMGQTLQSFVLIREKSCEISTSVIMINIINIIIRLVYVTCPFQSSDCCVTPFAVYFK